MYQRDYDEMEPSYYNEIETSIEERKELEHMRDHMQGLIDVLYNNKKDINDLEWHLQEVLMALEMKIPSGEIQVARIKE